MDITAAIAELNAATVSLAATMNATPETWRYIGDINLYHGGQAIKVDAGRDYAKIVTLDDLGSATGQDGCALIETGSVVLDCWSQRRRRVLRSALQAYGWKASDLLQFTRDERAAEIARVLWSYGDRDTDVSYVVRYDGATGDDIVRPRGGYMEPETDVTETGLVEEFMEYLN